MKQLLVIPTLLMAACVAWAAPPQAPPVQQAPRPWQAPPVQAVTLAPVPENAPRGNPCGLAGCPCGCAQTGYCDCCVSGTGCTVPYKDSEVPSRQTTQTQVCDSCPPGGSDNGPVIGGEVPPTLVFPQGATVTCGDVRRVMAGLAADPHPVVYKRQQAHRTVRYTYRTVQRRHQPVRRYNYRPAKAYHYQQARPSYRPWTPAGMPVAAMNCQPMFMPPEPVRMSAPAAAGCST